MNRVGPESIGLTFPKVTEYSAQKLISSTISNKNLRQSEKWLNLICTNTSGDMKMTGRKREFPQDKKSELCKVLRYLNNYFKAVPGNPTLIFKPQIPIQNKQTK